ncbi:MAG: hypothetical protein VR67_15540 [Peptococcaceae bacterium BRH_c8a]|nr:MAG: hypothetical protein VR67_15540 [Peptococcaceae bacterium BRH_c8a]
MKSFFFALQHLTRIRLYKGAFDDRAFGRSPVFFPIVGLILGLLLWLAKVFFGFVFPGPLVAALLVVTMAVLTGGIHLDGFMDTMDGVLSGRSREKKLEIMRDSRVGAFGALSLVCLLLLKFTALMTMPGEYFGVAIIMATVISRWAMVYVIAQFPYARREGLGELVAQYTGSRELLIATACTVVICVAAAGLAGLVLLLGAWCWAHLFGRWMTAGLGGVTGDVYGATAELTELWIYLLVFPVFGLLPAVLRQPGLYW